MSDRRDVLLDLSSWPDKDGGRGGPVLPPRPVRRRTPLPRISARFVAAGAGLLGLALLLVPLPGSGCGAPVAVWSAAPAPLPPAQGPVLDDSQLAQDTAAVQAADAALSAWVPAPAPRASSVATTVVRPASAQATARVEQLERAVAQDTKDVAAALRRRDAVVEQQQGSDDPNAYDAEVAAAQEELEEAKARLAGDRNALARARAQARSTTVTVSSPVPVAVEVTPGGASREDRVAALEAARRTQAEHLAQRREALGAWKLEHAAAVAQVTAANEALSTCQGRAQVAGGAGVIALLVAAVLGWRVRPTG